MIALAVALGMASSAAQAAPPSPPILARKALAACLSKFAQSRSDAKLDAAAFKSSAHSACAAEETAFKTGWVTYDTAMKTKRAEAEENAASQIEDYISNAADVYQSNPKS